MLEDHLPIGRTCVESIVFSRGVMSGIIGANNQFGHDFNSPNTKLQGTIVSIYDVSCYDSILCGGSIQKHVLC